ncbi:MAG: hypothetical protein AAF561_14545 [Planctomycetota bacterium]
MTAFTPSSNASAKPNPVTAFLETHRFALRRLHSLMGVVFGGYIVVHLLVNATLLQSAFPGIFGGDKVPADVYQSQVDKIHDLPFLVAIEWTAILIPLIFHAGYGILVAIAGRPNVTSYGFAKNWAYTAQRATSWVLLLFIAFHVLTMKGVIGGEFGDRVTFIPALATQTTVNHMHAAWWVGWVIYPIGILAATFHLSNGFWTAGITWGLTITAQSQKLWGLACAGLFVFTTACGLGSLGATLAAEPDFEGITEVIQGERTYEEYRSATTPSSYGE